jgi:hypothetical protein
MIKRIQIFGERCSGTNYLENLITSNFENVEITWDYGWKHWFPQNINMNNHNDCLFLVLFRDPYDYLSSLHNTPHHVDENLKNLRFSDFIRKEWKCVYDDISGIPENDPRVGTEMMFERNPDTGERFKNVLEMRNYKNKAFLSLEDSVKNYAKFKYEDLRKDPNILKSLCQDFELKLKSPDIVNYKKYKKSNTTYKPKTYKPISIMDRIYIIKNLDLKLEKTIGYNPKIIF